MVDYPKDWEIRRSIDLGNIITGSTPSTNIKEYWNGMYTWITPTDINSKIFMNSSERKLTLKGYNKSRKLKPLTVLVTCIASIGKNCILSVEGSCNQQINAIEVNKDNNNLFVYYLMEFNKEKLENLAGITATKILNKETFENITFNIPNLTEQKNIAETLLIFDRYIENLERLIEKKKMIRDGTLEDLITGKARLDGFEYDWEEVSFNDVIGHLKSGLSRELKNKDIGIPVVRANNIDNGLLYLDRDIKYWYIEDPKGANINNFLIQKDDILVNFINSESKMGTTAIVKNNPRRKTIYTTNILRMRVKKFFNPKFIFYITFTEKYKRYIKDISKIAVNQASFTTVDYKKFECKIPTDIKEQEEIASILTSMDEEIENLEKEKEKIEKIKAGAMDDLLTGRVRLI